MSSYDAEAIIISREEHLDGIWITALVEALSELSLNARVVSLQAALSLSVSESLIRNNSSNLVVINRVSDAAPPQEVKKGVAIMRDFEIKGIPIVNGISSFHIGTSKWLHHTVLTQAKAGVPRSILLQSWKDPYRPPYVTLT